MAFKAPVLRVLSQEKFTLSGSVSVPRLPPSPLFLCLSPPLRLSPCLSASLSLCVSLSSLVLTNWSCSRSLPGSCTTPQTRVETGSSRSQSEAWKNEGGGGWEEAALCVHIRVCVCVCVAGSPRVPPPQNPTTWALYISPLLLLLHFHFPTFHSVPLSPNLTLRLVKGN